MNKELKVNYKTITVNSNQYWMIDIFIKSRRRLKVYKLYIQLKRYIQTNGYFANCNQ